MKICSQCKVMKDELQFSLCGRGDYRRTDCKDCHRISVNRHRTYNLEYYHNNLEKVRASIRIHNAVRRGHMKKPNKCSKCGVILPLNKIHGHHEDYSKPLEVIWLCAGCHNAIHAKKEGKDG